MPETPSPFSPLTIGPLTLRNRFIKSGANEAMTVDGAPSKALVKHHRDLAAGGVAMTTTAYFAVAEVGRTLPNQIWLRKEIVPDLKVLSGAVHAEGAAISAQITHGGAFVTSIKLDKPAISSSGGINKAGLRAGNYFQRAMTEADMDEVAAEFVAGAKLCREGGFDAVEIHMGHGYLLNQFISPLSNKRRDRYGGSAENRVRFPAMVLARVKDAVGKDMAVIAKINVADGVKGGATPEDGAVTAKALEAAGADLLVLSSGRNIESVWYMFGSPMNLDAMRSIMKDSWSQRIFMKLATLGTPKDLVYKDLYRIEESRRIRAAVKMPLGYLGGATSLDNAKALVAEGFDAVVMARALIHDTGLINKFKSGEVTRSGCTHCNACVFTIYHPAGTACIENPPNDLALNQVRASVF